MVVVEKRLDIPGRVDGYSMCNVDENEGGYPTTAGNAVRGGIMDECVVGDESYARWNGEKQERSRVERARREGEKRERAKREREQRERERESAKREREQREKEQRGRESEERERKERESKERESKERKRAKAERERAKTERERTEREGGEREQREKEQKGRESKQRERAKREGECKERENARTEGEYERAAAATLRLSPDMGHSWIDDARRSPPLQQSTNGVPFTKDQSITTRAVAISDISRNLTNAYIHTLSFSS